MQTRIKQAIGAELSIVTDATEERELEIILEDTNRQEDEGIDFNALGEESFQVKNVGNDLLIAGTDRGLLYGVYAYNALAKISSDKKSNILSVSENDGGDYCRCEDCAASYAQYGVSGTFYRFINRIATDIKKDYPDIYIDTLSYSMSKEVPANLKLEDNVIVRVCPEMCNFCTDPNSCEQLAEQSKHVTDFSAICDNVYAYFYPINWGNLYAALPNYDEMLYDMKFFAESGVKGVYAEGYRSNSLTEAYFYGDRYAITNNTSVEQMTVFYDMDGNAQELTLKPYGIKWIQK